MTEVGAFEAKNTLGSLLDKVERGEEVVITRHGRPVALLTPYRHGFDRRKSTAAMGRIRARAKALGAGSFDWDTFKGERDADRP